MNGAKRPTRAPCEYRGWGVECAGGFITIKCYYATKGDRTFHLWRLRDVLDMVDALESGAQPWDDLDDFMKQDAYR